MEQRFIEHLLWTSRRQKQYKGTLFQFEINWLLQVGASVCLFHIAVSFLKRRVTNSKKKKWGGEGLELEPGGPSLNPKFVTPNCNS